jgi:GT2 family glycosyltransferase
VSEPLVSVVVATRGRPERLGRLLGSLRKQTLNGSSFEVVVVQDGEDPSSAAVLSAGLAQWARDGFALRAIALDVRRGPAAARNAGWRASRAPYVAFTDDDCVADPGWLAGVLEAMDSDLVVVQGRTAPDPAEAAFAGLFSRTVRVDSLGPQYETCNIVYPRTLLESLGGFDESFGSRPTAEDTDLAWRAIEAGARTRFAPSALVLHAVEPLGPARLLRVALRWGGAVRIFRAHPQLRTMLYRSLFWNVWHYLMWRTLLSLAGPAWLRRLLVARHLASLRERAREGGAGSWAIPFLLVHDLIECAAVARGAVRYRTLVL